MKILQKKRQDAHSIISEIRYFDTAFQINYVLVLTRIVSSLLSLININYDHSYRHACSNKVSLNDLTSLLNHIQKQVSYLTEFSLNEFLFLIPGNVLISKFLIPFNYAFH